MKLAKLGHNLASAIDFVSVKAKWIAVAAIAVIFGLVVVDVIGRYAFNHPVKGSNDLGELMLVIVAFAPMAYTQVAKEHVQVGLLFDRFSPRAQAISNTFGFLCGTAMYALIAWNLGKRAWQLTAGTSALTSVSPVLGIPHAPFVYAATLFSILFCLVFLADSVRSAAKLTGRPSNGAEIVNKV